MTTVEEVRNAVTEERDGLLTTIAATYQTLREGLDIEKGLISRLGRAESGFARARIGTRKFVVISDAELVTRVLQTNRLNYVKSPEYEPIRIAAGVNLLTDEGDSWAEHRAVLNPKFAKREINGLIELMVAPIESMADDLDGHTGRQVIDMHEEMVQMTLRVVANALFSQDFGVIVDNMHRIATRGLVVAEGLMRLGLVGALPVRLWRGVLRPVMYSSAPLPPPFNEWQSLVHELDEAVNQVVDERYDNPTDTPDLLNTLVNAADGTWGGQRVRDEALTVMLAGHETTANALSWFWYLMALNPASRQRMYDEIDEVVGDDPITADHIANLPWTAACLMESQRYYSAVPLVVRTALQDDMIGAHFVEKGTAVVVAIHSMHHSERYWKEPEEFDPNRFFGDAPRPVRSSYLPFGAGRRVCIGQTFAHMEMVAIAAGLARRFEFDLVPGHPVEAAESLTLRPRHGVEMVVRRRDRERRAAHVPGKSEARATSSGDAEQPVGCPVHPQSEGANE